MADPKGLVYSGSDNTGYAAVLDNSTFDPNVFMGRMAAMREAQQQRKYNEALAKDKERKAAMAKLVGTPSSEKFLPKYQQFFDEAETRLAGAGDGDLFDISTPVGKEFAKMQTELRAMEGADKAYMTTRAKFMEYVKQNMDDLDPEEVRAYAEGLDSVDNPQAALDYMTSKPWPEPALTIEDMVLDLKVPRNVTENMVKWNQSRKTNEPWLEEDYKKLYKNVAMLDPKNKRNYDYGVRHGWWTNTDEMYDKLGGVAYAFGQGNKESTLEGAPNAGRGGGLLISNGAATEKDWTVVPVMDANGNWTYAAIDYKGGFDDKTPVLELTDNTGELFKASAPSIKNNFNGTYTAEFVVDVEEERPAANPRDKPIKVTVRTPKTTTFRRGDTMHASLVAAMGGVDPIANADEVTKQGGAMKPDKPTSKSKFQGVPQGGF